MNNINWKNSLNLNFHENISPSTLQKWLRIKRLKTNLNLKTLKKNVFIKKLTRFKKDNLKTQEADDGFGRVVEWLENEFLNSKIKILETAKLFFFHLKRKFTKTYASVTKRTMPSSSLWTQSKILEPLSKQNLFDLFDKRIPGILIPRFIPEADCAKLVSTLLKEDISNYTNTPNVDIGKLGLSHMECFEADEQVRYFSEAKMAQEKLFSIFKMAGINPLKKLQDLIKTTSNLPVSIPIEESLNESSYFAGIFRIVRSGIPPHFDSAVLEYPPEVSVSKVNAQLSWNLYLTEGPSGGELVLYEMDAGQLRETGILGPQDWLVPTEVLDKVSAICYKPRVGDIVLFNSQCIHSVNKPGSYDRITMSSFIGYAPDNQIWFWS